MKVLVLGANGFVGTHVSLLLQKQKDMDLVLGCRDASKLLKSLHSEEIREGDLRDEVYRKEVCQGIDVCVNLASWSSLYGHKKDSSERFYKPTIALISAAKKAGVKKYINLSTVSAAAFGEATDANAPGEVRSFWPHLNNVIAIEDHLREHSCESFQVINLRSGLFVGKHYALGLLPILLPRLKTHLVPLVSGGETQMPLIDGKDLAQAFYRAIVSGKMENTFESFNVIGNDVPKVKQVLKYLHHTHGYPYPHFSVPFFLAYPFAALLEWINPLLPFEPLVVRSIIHLLEDTHVNNTKAQAYLGYVPRSDWRQSIDEQINEMQMHQHGAMPMSKGFE